MREPQIVRMKPFKGLTIYGENVSVWLFPSDSLNSTLPNAKVKIIMQADV